MAWIESHQSLKDHPKLADICSRMNWTPYEGIGRMQCFWWWCLDYAIDGDLRKHNDNRIAMAMGVAMEDSKRLVEALVEACWLERVPYFRVHDWWDYVGKFLQIKWKHSPKAWSRVRQLYQKKERPKERFREPYTNLTNQPNLTNHVQGGADAPSVALSEKIDAAYGKERGYHKDSRTVLFFLNEACGRHYREVDANLSVISQRLKEPGVDIEGVKAMILRQCKEWGGTEFDKFIRPETLFRKSKFESYYANRNEPIRESGRDRQSRPDRNKGTFNEGCADDYDLEKIRSSGAVRDVGRPTT